MPPSVTICSQPSVSSMIDSHCLYMPVHMHMCVYIYIYMYIEMSIYMWLCVTFGHPRNDQQSQSCCSWFSKSRIISWRYAMTCLSRARSCAASLPAQAFQTLVWVCLKKRTGTSEWGGCLYVSLSHRHKTGNFKIKHICIPGQYWHSTKAAPSRVCLLI